MAAPKIQILLADDDAIIRNAIKRYLVQVGFEVQSAIDGSEACAYLESLTDSFPQLLITDMDMPGHNGEELARITRQFCGDTKVLFTSGAPQPELVRAIANDSHSRFLQKPFGGEKLLQSIRDLGFV